MFFKFLIFILTNFTIKICAQHPDTSDSLTALKEEDKHLSKFINENFNIILERRKLVAERDNQIAAVERKIIEKDNLIIKKDTQIIEGDNNIIEKNKQLIEAQMEAEKFRSHLKSTGIDPDSI